MTAQYFISAAFLPLLFLANQNTKGYSSIVVIAPISGVIKGSSSGQFTYAASRAAFIHLTGMLAITLTETKIRVDSIAPGIIPSEMTTGKAMTRRRARSIRI